MSKKPMKCLCPNCEKAGVYCRGLCKYHYMSAHYAIKSGETTWEKLESRGAALPSKRTGRAASWLTGE